MQTVEGKVVLEGHCVMNFLQQQKKTCHSAGTVLVPLAE
jgi:hypothetical protein